MKINYNNIDEVINLLKEFKILVWLSHGTLLGIFRDLKIIPWDSDIDLAVDGPATIKNFKALKTKFLTSGYHLEYNFNRILCLRFDKKGLPIALELNWPKKNDLIYLGGAWGGLRKTPKIIRLIDQVFFRPIILLLTWPQSRKTHWGVAKTLIWFIGYPIHKILFTARFMTWFSILNFHRHHRSPYAHSVNLIFPICNFLIEDDFIFPIPKSPQSILTATYGPDWKVPNKNFDKSTCYSFNTFYKINKL
jgi:hypothetical protein